MNKVIHISRKQKISRTRYAEYKLKNELKAFYHKIGALGVSIFIALMVGVGMQLAAVAVGFENSSMIGIVSALISFVASMGLAIYSHYKKEIIFWGILALGTFNCNYGLGNTGEDCTPKMGAPKKFWFMNYFNAAGNQNRIQLLTPGTIACAGPSTTILGTNTTFLTTFTVGDIIIGTGLNQILLITAIATNTSLTVQVAPTVAIAAGTAYNALTNQFYWRALANHPDATRRIYPAPFVKNGDATRADFIMQVWEDNTEEAIMQGVKKVSGIVPKAAASPQLAAKMQTFASNNSLGLGFFVLDYTNNLHITDILDGNAYPMQIDENSFRSIYNIGKIKEGAKIDVMFNVHSNEIDGNMNVIAASNFGPGVNLGIIKGLKDASIVYGSLAHAAITISFTTLYGDAITTTQVHGLQKSNFISKVTGTAGTIACTGGTDAGTDIVIASCVEQNDGNGKPNGTYLLTLTAASATDVLSPNISMLDYDFSAPNVSTAVLV